MSCRWVLYFDSIFIFLIHTFIEKLWTYVIYQIDFRNFVLDFIDDLRLKCLSVSRNCLGCCSLQNIIIRFWGRLFFGTMVRFPFGKNFHIIFFFILSGKFFIFFLVFDSLWWFLWFFILRFLKIYFWFWRLFWLRYRGHNLIFCEFGFEFLSWFRCWLRFIFV